MSIGGINQFSYNGKRSFDDFGLIIEETPPFVVPERDIDFISVQGRSGDIINDNNRYKNLTKEYKVTMLTDILPLNSLASAVGSWLEGETGYKILYDTYDTGYFRYACFDGRISVANMLMQLGRATLKFNCKPFKYSFCGQKQIKIDSASTLINTESAESNPYIKIAGSGDITLSINNSSFLCSSVDEYIEIDSELCAAFKGTALQNNKISFLSFPKLAPGKNNISFVGNVSEITIVPRWCSL